MGSGLSMASVNKIKELANQREYSLALDIIDSQDLSKSLNPQFLKLCGEVFIKSKRYVDARRTLVRAHCMAPEAKRIIYDLIDLYSKMGYKELVDKYYDIYMYDAEEDNIDTKQVQYIYEKYNGAELDKIREYIIPYYTDNMDYDWSFEAYLLLMLSADEDDDEILKALVDEYSATFKNSDNLKIIDSIKDDKSIASSKLYNFNKEVMTDDDISQKDIRREEKKILDADFERINPPEATIIEVVDEEEKKSRPFFKRKHDDEQNNEESEEDKSEDSSEEKTDDKMSSDTDSDDNLKEKRTSDISKDDESRTPDNKIGNIFKKIFSRNKNSDSAVDEIKDEDDTSKKEESDAKVQPDSEEEKESTGMEVKSESEEETSGTERQSESEEMFDEEVQPESEEEKDSTDMEVQPESEEEKEEHDLDVQPDDNEFLQKDEDNSMQGSGRSIDVNNEEDFSEDDFEEFFEDDVDEFAAESETIEELTWKEKTDLDISDNQESLKSSDDSKPVNKSDVLFEDVDISFDEDEDDYEIDDFSSPKHDDFGSMFEDDNTEKEQIFESEEVIGKSEFEPEPELETEPEFEIEPESEIESELETEPESEIEPELEIETEPESEIEPEFEIESEPQHESESETDQIEHKSDLEDEMENPEFEQEFDGEPEFEPESEPIEQESETEDIIGEPEPIKQESDLEDEMEKLEFEQEYDTESESKAEPESESIEHESVTEEIIQESEPVLEEQVTEMEIDKETETEEDLAELYRLEKEKIKKENKEKKLDFPVFRSSLFPNYHNNVPEVENNFNEIMNDSRNKIDENFEKEARLQKETEALLASLGISIGNSNSTNIKSGEETVKKENKEDSIKDVSPKISRNEMKSSLKIDADKKNLLRKMKEYR